MSQNTGHEKSFESQGIRLLRQLFLRGKRIFSTEDAKQAAKLEKIPDNQLNKILSVLAKRNLTLRLRRGLYVSMGLLPDRTDLHPFVVSAFLVQPSVISFWSALHHHGLTEQIPQTIYASTTQKILTPSMRAEVSDQAHKKHAFEINHVRYEYITIQENHFFGHEKIWIDENFRISITDKERTIVDLFAFSKVFGGMGEAMGILESALPSIDVKKLIEYAIQYNKKSLIKRLGWALSQFGISEKKLAVLQKIPIHYFCRLDSSKPAVGPCDKHWMIQNNLTPKGNE